MKLTIGLFNASNTSMKLLATIGLSNASNTSNTSANLFVTLWRCIGLE